MTPSRQQEQNLLEALTAPGTGWMSTWEESYDIIRGQCACPSEEAEKILEDIYAMRHLIVYIGEHGGVDTSQKPASYRWGKPK
jgi:hypothetical protein